MKLPIIIALIGATLLLPACSMLTHNGRQQAAYARYVRKSSLGRVRQQKIFRSKKPSMPVTEPGQATVTAEESGPQAVTANVP
jgi:hypothetical protein